MYSHNKSFNRLPLLTLCASCQIKQKKSSCMTHSRLWMLTQMENSLRKKFQRDILGSILISARRRSLQKQKEYLRPQIRMETESLITQSGKQLQSIRIQFYKRANSKMHSGSLIRMEMVPYQQQKSKMCWEQVRNLGPSKFLTTSSKKQTSMVMV